MLHREPDAEAFRSALARELVPVEPRPGGWERVRATLAHGPTSRSRPRWMAWLLLTASLLAAAMIASAFVTWGGDQPTARAAGPAVEAPPIVPVGAALLAIATPLSLGEARRLLVRQP